MGKICSKSDQANATTDLPSRMPKKHSKGKDSLIDQKSVQIQWVNSGKHFATEAKTELISEVDIVAKETA